MPVNGRLRLLSRPDCGLCEETAALLRRMRVEFNEVNIEQDDALERRYGEAIPVLLAGDEELARAPMTESGLRSVLGDLVRR